MEVASTKSVVHWLSIFTTHSLAQAQRLSESVRVLRQRTQSSQVILAQHAHKLPESDKSHP